MDDSNKDFLLHFAVKFHSTKKVAPYKSMMNDIKKLLENKEKNIKRILKTKIVSVIYRDDYNIRVSNYIKILTKSISFSSSNKITKVIYKAKTNRIGKVIYSRRNYYKIRQLRIAFGRNN